MTETAFGSKTTVIAVYIDGSILWSLRFRDIRISNNSCNGIRNKQGRISFLSGTRLKMTWGPNPEYSPYFTEIIFSDKVELETPNSCGKRYFISLIKNYNFALKKYLKIQ